MKNLKNQLPLFAMMIGLGLVFTQSAFKPKQDTLYWFQVDTSTGAISSYLGNEEPGGDCASEEVLNPTCSVAFEQADISDPGNPVAPISNVNSDPMNRIDDRKHIIED